ncbi:hypothetical protein CHU_2967 [Cytophaga hutchinsonii ATCC 33406]|uniref:Uncharacterized protein n=1 Tax=Cytophaga hutchinsonii (strain ATCC 33406 / DSM 1761 / CIP 103989 / NBRC 15051 / NCIMB 9469 / D465) TaxID=269798 RepID=A0A6N4SV55_CYTH3|nr:hypothetical protein CHU_2967 [Cytophaga hutchinsonii ATCC 33406]
MTQDTKFKSIKMDKSDYFKLISLQHYFLHKRQIVVNKKNLLGWVLRKAYQDLLKYEEANKIV